MTTSAPKPLLVVVSGPSGVGKTTLCDMLLSEYPDLTYSVSCTTRPPRGKERDGEDYHFLTRESFDERIAADAFLEYAEVHGYLYGTLRETVRQALGAGRSVLMDIDVQGARRIREHLSRADADPVLRRGFVDVFIAPPSLAVLAERLVARGEDSAETIARRLRNALEEVAARGEFRHTVVNEALERAYARLKAIVEAERYA